MRRQPTRPSQLKGRHDDTHVSCLRIFCLIAKHICYKGILVGMIVCVIRCGRSAQAGPRNKHDTQEFFRINFSVTQNSHKIIVSPKNCVVISVLSVDPGFVMVVSSVCRRHKRSYSSLPASSRCKLHNRSTCNWGCQNHMRMSQPHVMLWSYH